MATDGDEVTERLLVRFGSELVGHLRADDARFCFEYDRGWLERDEPFPISLSIPLQETELVGGAAHAFFANLLPEGAVRQAVCNRLGISESNDFALLHAIGGECAGALSIVDPDARVRDDDDEYEELDRARLQSMVSDDIVPLLIGGPTTRLSLAGAQDKLPVASIDGQLHLPLHGAPSTHILKLPNARFANLPVNEAFVLGLASHLKLDVAGSELLTVTNPPSLLVARYDRTREGGEIRRLHQEDICQALGLRPSSKYEQEGGPSLARTIALIRDHVRRPLVDVTRLIEWQAYNIVAGNSDGHGKNLSVLYASAGELELAPLYDLVCTREYERLDRLLAMSVGGRRNPDEIGRAQWTALAHETSIAARTVLDLVGGVAERVLAALAEWSAEFRQRYGEQAVLQTLPKRIRKQAERVARSL